MAQAVCTGAQLQCSFGTTPSSLTILPTNRVNTSNNPAGTIMDHMPMTNIMPFGMCITVTNPQVAAATSAAMGVLTPQPCIPNTVTPWTPGSSTIMIGGQPVLNNSSTCNCVWTGVISVVNAGQQTVNVP